MQFSNRHLIVATLLAACIFFIGCEPEQSVKTYAVARTSGPRAPFPLDQVDQILVAIVPQDGTAWFFKLVGKKPAIERHLQAFDDFLATVQLAATAGETPTWELPKGWSEQGKSEIRAATLIVPDADGKLELAVSSLPLTVEWEDFLVPNVNRWLGQLQCDRLTKSEILKLAKSSPTAEATSTVFHLAGLKPLKPMSGNPHAGLGIDPTASKAAAPKALPAGELKYEKPSEWLPGKMSIMRKAAFQLPGGQAAGEVTVTSFPAGGGQMSDVSANIQRWAGQVGMEMPTGDALDKLTKKITIGGIEGTYAELASPEQAERPTALFVAMLERQGQVWFFKMIGRRKMVTGQRSAFREFLDSVEFN